MKFEIDIHHHFHGDEEQRMQPADHWLYPMMERIMAQLDDLQADGATIKADLDLIKTHLSSQADKLASLTAQLEQLQQTTPPQVDLSGVVAAANDIRSEADAIVASFTPASAPVDGAVAGDASAGSAPVGGDTGSSSGSTADAGGTGTVDAGAGSSTGTADAGSTDASAGTADAGAGATVDAGAGTDVSGSQPDQQPV